MLARADMDASGKSVEPLGRALLVRERLETKKTDPRIEMA
jgi:hypothetical protein